MNKLYFSVMLAASCSMIITGIILAFVKSPFDERAAKFRIAKHGLTVAVLVLGVLNLLQIGIDPGADIKHLPGCIALAVSYFQAMIFTMAVLVLIRPAEVTLKFVIIQVVAIFFMDAVLFTSFFLLPLNLFFYVYELGILLYIVLLIFYTRKYLQCNKRFKEQITAYYEEEEIERGLRWLNIVFWVALSVGVLSLLMLIGNKEIDLCLTVALALFYAMLAACFINYALSTPVILPAISENLKTVTTNTKKDAGHHPDKLIAWIDKGGYLNTLMAVEDIANELNMTVSQFRLYFKKVIGEDFRTWRVKKRIEHAQQIMAEQPDFPVTKVAQESGFNDRSYFYQQFQIHTGMSVSDYRAKIAKTN